MLGGAGTHSGCLFEAIIAPEQRLADANAWHSKDAKSDRLVVAARRAALTPVSLIASVISPPANPDRSATALTALAWPRSRPSLNAIRIAVSAKVLRAPRRSETIIARATSTSFVGHGSGQRIGPKP